MTDLEILRAALRAYQDAATDAFCTYRPEESDAGPTFARFVALDRVVPELRYIIADVARGRPAVAAVRSWLSPTCSALRREAADALRDDLLLRLSGEPGQIPECM